jgi:hypothetical protein
MYRYPEKRRPWAETGRTPRAQEELKTEKEEFPSPWITGCLETPSPDLRCF